MLIKSCLVSSCVNHDCHWLECAAGGLAKTTVGGATGDVVASVGGATADVVASVGGATADVVDSVGGATAAEVRSVYIRSGSFVPENVLFLLHETMLFHVRLLQYSQR